MDHTYTLGGSFHMRRFLAVLTVGLVCAGCAVSTEATPDDDAEATADELSSSFTYRCSPSDGNMNNGWGVQYLRVSPTRATYGTSSTLTVKSGAQRADHDAGYVAKSGTPYVRYVLKYGNGDYTEWKVEPDMLTGGKTMRGGDLGGFVILGARVDSAWGSAKYVCFRRK
jgi:hypothetical protein